MKIVNLMNENKAKEDILYYLNELPPSYRDGAYLMVYFTAIAGTFDIDLLYRIYYKCNKYIKNNKECVINVVAIADVVHSVLCNKCGYETYTMNEDVVKYFNSLTIDYIKERRNIIIPENTPVIISEIVKKYKEEHGK